MVTYFSIGDRIRERRIELNMNQEDVCQKLQDKGIKFYRQKLAKLENGIEVPVSVPQICALASVLQCDVGYIMGEIQEKTYTVREACRLLDLTEKAVTNMISCRKTPSNMVLCHLLEADKLYSVIIPIILKCVSAFVQDRELTLKTVSSVLSQNEEDLILTAKLLEDFANEAKEKRVNINSSLPDIVKDKGLSSKYLLDDQENIYQRFLYSLSIADSELYRGIIDSIVEPISEEIARKIKQAYINRGSSEKFAEESAAAWTLHWKS